MKEDDKDREAEVQKALQTSLKKNDRVRDQGVLDSLLKSEPSWKKGNALQPPPLFRSSKESRQPVSKVDRTTPQPAFPAMDQGNAATETGEATDIYGSQNGQPVFFNINVNSIEAV